MKKITSTIYCLAIAALLILSSCKGKVNDTMYGITPTSEQDMTNKALRTDGRLITGSFPAATSGNNRLSISNFFKVFEVSGGTLLSLPISTNADSTVCKIYLMVKGANSYWDVPVVRDSFGSLSVNIFVPAIIKNNNFILSFAVAGCNGTISSPVETQVVITNTPTTIQGAIGTPRFNLQFTPGVDFDIHVLTPNGNEIYFSNKHADQGSLDVDCICCDDPDENIFWLPGTAPKGEYKYWVHFYNYCTVPSSSFILRVLNNSQVLQLHTGTLTRVGQDSQKYIFNLN